MTDRRGREASGVNERPTGTVTFLFTDIEGSTTLWEKQPAAMRLAQARHDEMLREAVARQRGWVFSTAGDGLGAAFARAGDAVEAAVAAQMSLATEPWPDPVVLHVRMGLHTGEAEERDGDYFGPAVNRAARIMASADGGHVILSSTTVEVVRGELRADLALVDVGERDLRSLSQPEHVFELIWPGSPPPTTGPRTRSTGNLPLVVRPLIGRDDQLGAVTELLARRRLVTLTGTGGAGKTSLALATARETADAYADGVWFCDLAAIVQSEDVMPAISEMLGLRPQPGVTVADGVLRALAQQQCLLVLDNCEHVLDVAATLAESVGERCQKVTVLTTSREGLGLPGEELVEVRPLDIADAVELFRVRAGEHHGWFEQAGADEALIHDLCERLDGLPLAIELAAARARSMPLADLTARLSERFRLLRGQRRVDRHQTLRATVAWSYGLLSDDERQLFNRLSVFTGGFSLAAAEAVCADSDLDVVAVDELVATLVDKSMIVADAMGRYRLLETLRQFGDEQLEAVAGGDRFHRAHLAYFAGFAVSCHDGLQTADQAEWWQRMHADWANIRAAFAWAKATDDVTRAAIIATHLMWPAVWHDVSEPYTWIRDVADMEGAETSGLWHNILAGTARAAWENGRNEEALELGFQAMAAEPDGQTNLDYFAEYSILAAAYFLSKVDLAEEYLERVIERSRADGRVAHESVFVASSAVVHVGHGRLEEGLATARHARELGTRSGNPTAISWALAQEGAALLLLGDPAAADVLESGLVLGEQTGSVLGATGCRRILSHVLLNSGRVPEAVQLLLDDLRIMRRRAAWMFLYQSLFGIAIALAELGASEPAATLYGSTYRSSTATAPDFARRLDVLHRKLLGALDERVVEDLIATGERLEPEQAAAFAEAALVAVIPS